MLETYAHLTSHRSWWVRDYAVWGEAGAESFELIANEIAASSRTILFFQSSIGGAEQEVLFSTLTDHRDNALPSTLNNPLIIVIPKSATPVTVIGEPTSSSFKIARMDATTPQALVDLWIVEMGS
jgi:hypothetical protein